MTAASSPYEATETRTRSGRHYLATIAVACGSALALAGIAAAGTLAGTHHPAGHMATAKASTAGVFHVRCPYSHTANDDPIVKPGQPGAAMLHDFFGNRGTNADSTSATLAGTPTTCGTDADASAYWTPALYGDGKPIVAISATNYWLGASRTGPTALLPAGLQMIAGDPQGMTPQPLQRLFWDCHATTGPAGMRNHTAKTNAPHTCPAGDQIRLTIKFPSCWDGHTLSAVGQTNVVDPAGSACPSSHPVGLPRLVAHVFYPNRFAGTFTLSMAPGMEGSIHSEHADFMDGWKASTIDRLVTTCLSAHKRCGAVNGHMKTPRAVHHRHHA